MRGQATGNKKAVPRKNLETASINRGTTQIAYKICHLFGLKRVLYEQPYENPVRQTDYPGFCFCRRVPVSGSIALSGGAEIRALFAMTPYYWKTPRGGAEKLEQLNTLQTEIEFDFLIYQKKKEP